MCSSLHEQYDCRWRGLFDAFYQISLVIGVFLTYAVSAIPNVSYTHSALVGTGLVVLFFVLALTLPESPRFLLWKGRESKAKKVLYWLRQSAETAEEELAEIKQIIETHQKLSLKMKLQEFQSKACSDSTDSLPHVIFSDNSVASMPLYMMQLQYSKQQACPKLE